MHGRLLRQIDLNHHTNKEKHEMKTLLACMAAILMAIPTFAGTQVCIKVDGMTCGGCEGKVKKAVAQLKGVTLTEVSAKTGTAKLTLDEKASKADVMAAINKTGLKAVGEQVTYKVDGMTCGACEGKVTKALAKTCESACTDKVAKVIASTGFKVQK
jgi:copper chaperone CopZ